jgi:hypothetical protein
MKREALGLLLKAVFRSVSVAIPILTVQVLVFRCAHSINIRQGQYFQSGGKSTDMSYICWFPEWEEMELILHPFCSI